MARVPVRPLNSVEERSGKFSIRRKNSVAGRRGREQGPIHAILSPGRSAACASSNSSILENTVART